MALERIQLIFDFLLYMRSNIPYQHQLMEHSTEMMDPTSCNVRLPGYMKPPARKFFQHVHLQIGSIKGKHGQLSSHTCINIFAIGYSCQQYQHKGKLSLSAVSKAMVVASI